MRYGSKAEEECTVTCESTVGGNLLYKTSQEKSEEKGGWAVSTELEALCTAVTFQNDPINYSISTTFTVL